MGSIFNSRIPAAIIVSKSFNNYMVGFFFGTIINVSILEFRFPTMI